MATATSDIGSGSIIAGYFKDGEDAHRAINALLDEGFLASQIGAAFHTSGIPRGTESDDSADDSIGREFGTFNEQAGDMDRSAGGAASGSDAVQPVGLSSGSGSVILGAGAPGPIPGSELKHTGLPSELHSELAHDQPGSAPYQAPAVVPEPQHHTAKAGAGWTDKLKHLFQSKHSDQTADEQDSQEFGTGEGHLILPSPYGHPYSQPAFESSLSGAGIEHSRHLSHRLSTGGAVVTVSDTGRSVEVEKIFERYNGVVRFAGDVFEDSPALDYEPRVEVFGHLEHRYRVL
jgi:hypothetical protein